MEMSRNRPDRKPVILWKILLLVFAVLFLMAAAMAAYTVLSARKERSAFRDLAEKVAEKREDAIVYPYEHGHKPEEVQMKTILPEYEELYEQNPDLFGWVRINGTTLDYPVMYTPNAPEYYLHRAFDGTHAWSGVPFLDGTYTEDSSNYLLHGHHMRNGAMFAELLNYAAPDYWMQHPIIHFDTLYDKSEYQVMAVFYSRVYGGEETDVFRYYHYGDLTEKEDFEEYVRQAESAALYETGIHAEYGDTLLTLTTCSYHVADGRFVVVACKRMD